MSPGLLGPVGSIYSFNALTWSFTGRQRVGTTIGETGGSRLVEVPTSGATAPPLSREAAGQSAHRVFGPNRANPYFRYWGDTQQSSRRPFAGHRFIICEFTGRVLKGLVVLSHYANSGPLPSPAGVPSQIWIANGGEGHRWPSRSGHLWADEM